MIAQNPLTKANIANLHKTVVALNEAQRQIDAAKQAGVDVSEHEERQQFAMGLAKGLLAVYGPQGPPKVD